MKKEEFDSLLDDLRLIENERPQYNKEKVRQFHASEFNADEAELIYNARTDAIEDHVKKINYERTNKVCRFSEDSNQSLFTYQEPSSKENPVTNSDNEHNLWATTDALEESYYDPALDNRKLNKTDTRKAKLTLKHLNKLNAYRKQKEKELNQRLKRVAVVYGSNTDEPNDDDTRKVKQTITDKPDKDTGRINREVKTEREVKIKEATTNNQFNRTDLDEAYENNEALELYGLFFDLDELDQEVYGYTSKEKVKEMTLNAIEAFKTKDYIYCDIDHGDDCLISELHRSFGVLNKIRYSNGKIYGCIRLLQDNDNARQLLDLYRITGEIPISMRSMGSQIMGFDAVSDPAINTARCQIRKVK